MSVNLIRRLVARGFSCRDADDHPTVASVANDVVVVVPKNGSCRLAEVLEEYKAGKLGYGLAMVVGQDAQHRETASEYGVPFSVTQGLARSATKARVCYLQ